MYVISVYLETHETTISFLTPSLCCLHVQKRLAHEELRVGLFFFPSVQFFRDLCSFMSWREAPAKLGPCPWTVLKAMEVPLWEAPSLHLLQVLKEVLHQTVQRAEKWVVLAFSSSFVACPTHSKDSSRNIYQARCGLDLSGVGPNTGCLQAAEMPSCLYFSASVGINSLQQMKKKKF